MSAADRSIGFLMLVALTVVAARLPPRRRQLVGYVHAQTLRATRGGPVHWHDSERPGHIAVFALAPPSEIG